MNLRSVTADDATWRRETFERYALDRRAARLPGFRLEQLADLTRHLPLEGDDEAVLSFARLAAPAADARIGEELALIERNDWGAEWKVHDFDEPADLRARLESRGLNAHHTEALMVLDVDRAPEWQPIPADAFVERAEGTALGEIARFQEEVWKCRLPWLGGVLRLLADPEHGSGVVYCARVEGRVVGSGWIDFLDGSPFAQLSGGSVLEAHRGRGIYSALFARRIADAKRRGVPFIAVDAAPMSRPILERKGFRFVCNTYPMRTRPFESD